MPRRNSTIKIVDGKVVFSEEVLSYFESIRNEENSIWIDKYFEYLSDEENLSAEKYNGHHIIPCFTFKDETHRTRKETEPLADKIEGNIIELSIYNHLLAHYCLWKIYDNRDSKNTMQRMCGEEKYIDTLTEQELKEIAILKEECAKKNLTEEERKKKKYARVKKYKNSHKQQVSEQGKRYRELHKEEKARYDKEYRRRNKEKISKRKKEDYEKNKDKISEKGKQLCFDPIQNKPCTLNALRCRKRRNKELYKDVAPTQCIIEN